jgi:hypothetical protein
MSKTERKCQVLRRCAAVAAGLFAIATVAFLICFPGRQPLLALTLASGVGIGGLQARVDAMEQKATDGERFTEVGKALRDLFSPGLNGTRRSNGH